MNIATVGLNVAKTALHLVDLDGKVLERRTHDVRLGVS